VSSGAGRRWIVLRWRSGQAGASVLGLDLRAYDVSSDAQRFVMIKDLEDPSRKTAALSHLIMVLNWAEELKQRLPAR
jgi:hypothetical protein